MIKRILTAVGLLVVLFGFLLGLRQVHVAFVSAIIALLSIMATYELTSALKKANYNPMIILDLIASLIVPIATIFLSYFGIMLAIIVFALSAITIFTFKHNYELKDLFASIVALIYPILPISILIIMNNESFGLYSILLCVIIPIMTDTMAYFVGRFFGKKKLCPEISPKKTIAGAIGGVIGGVVGAILIFLAFDYGNIFASFKNVEQIAITDSYLKSILIYVTLGLVAAPLCEVGDLAASWIKRKAGIKDYGNIFPGHGGIMDRLDSIIYMIPITIIFTLQISGI